MSVATSTRRTMGTGLGNRAACTSERSWVLSPISARPTMLVETRNDSMLGCDNRAAQYDDDDTCLRDPVRWRHASSVLPGDCCTRHASFGRKYVDVHPGASRAGRL